MKRKLFFITLILLALPALLYAEVFNFPVKRAEKIYLSDGTSVEYSIGSLSTYVSGIISNLTANYYTKTAIDINFATTGSVLIKTNNLSDVNNATTARTNLGLGTAATKNTGTASGEIPVLDSDGKLSSTVVPALALVNSYSVADTTELIALDVDTGAIAIVTSLSKTYILHEAPASTLSNWWEIITPTAGVSSVNTKTGAVTIDKSDMGLGNVLNAEQMTTAHSANTITGYGDGTATTIARTDDPRIVDVANKAAKSYVDANFATTGAVALKANTADVYTKVEDEALFATKANLATKANASETYTKTEVQEKLTDYATTGAVALKADKTYVDSTVENHANTNYIHGLPTPVAQSGKYLKSNGSTYELAEVTGGSSNTTPVELKSEIATNTGDNTSYDLAAEYETTAIQIVVNGLLYDTSLYTFSVASNKTRITFNTALGASDEVAILRLYGSAVTSDDLANYYNKSEIDSATAPIALKANAADVYTQGQIDAKLSDKADTNTVALKADASNVYTKAEIDADRATTAAVALVDAKATSHEITLAKVNPASTPSNGTFYGVSGGAFGYYAPASGITKIYGGTDDAGTSGSAVTIKAGSNVTVTRTGDTIEIASTASGTSSGGSYSAWTNLGLIGYRTDDDTFTVADNTTSQVYIKKGLPVKFVINSATYYALVNAITDNGDTLAVDICGAPFIGDVTSGNLYAGTAEKVKQVNYAINGFFADAAESTLLANDMFIYYKWDLPKAYLCKTSIRAKTIDSGAANSRVNVTLGTSDVLTTNSNAGLTVSNAWANSTIDLSTSNYDIDFSDTVEIKVDNNSTNKDAKDLSVQLNFVME